MSRKMNQAGRLARNGLLAAVMALAAQGCAGLNGANGANGKDGINFDSSEVKAAGLGKVCSEFLKDGKNDGTEPSLTGRKFKVEAVDRRGVVKTNFTSIGDQFADKAGCVENLQVYAGQLNKVTLTDTNSGQNPVRLYVIGKDIASLQTTGSGDVLNINPIWDKVGDFLESRLLSSGAYDFTKPEAASALIAMTEKIVSSGDMQDAWEEEVLDKQGEQFITDVLGTDPSLLAPFVAEGMNACAPIARPDREFEDGGSAGTAAFELGDGNNFTTAFDSANTDSCNLSEFNGIAIDAGDVTYTIGGTAITDATVIDSCTKTDFDDKYAGIHGVETSGDATLQYGFVQLSKGIDDGEDNFAYIPAGIAYMGMKAVDSGNGDIELLTGDYQQYDFDNNMFAANTVVVIDNMPEEQDQGDATDLTGFIDEDTSWFVVEDVAEATAFDDEDGDGLIDEDDYKAAVEATDKDAFLVQECNPSDLVEFTVTSGATFVVKQSLSETVTVTEEDEDEKRIIPAHMLMVHFDASDTDMLSNIMDAAGERLVASGVPNAENLFDTNDFFDENGDLNVPTVKMATMIAEAGALCVPEVTAINSDDDTLALERDSDGKITKYLQEALPKNCCVAGLAPYQEFTSTCHMGENKEISGVDGAACFTCAPDVEGNYPSSVTVSSEGQSMELGFSSN